MPRNKLLSIAEVARKIGLINSKTGKPSTHTIRFWEKKFKQIKPKKFSGNRRFYSDKDVSALKFVRYLLKDQRLTINGAIKVMNKNINTLDDFKSSSIKVEYFRNKIKTKSKKLLLKIKKLKI
tara:strand:- start:474 stop:842 length:369 start_codon:yes stop_codon:yes gene_type:complete